MCNEEMQYWIDKQNYAFNEHQQQMRPCVLWKPKLYLDGDQWCALYGDNIQDGVAGFGDTPEKAVEDFDKNWKMSIQHPLREEEYDCPIHGKLDGIDECPLC